MWWYFGFRIKHGLMKVMDTMWLWCLFVTLHFLIFLLMISLFMGYWRICINIGNIHLLSAAKRRAIFGHRLSGRRDFWSSVWVWHFRPPPPLSQIFPIRRTARAPAAESARSRAPWIVVSDSLSFSNLFGIAFLIVFLFRNSVKPYFWWSFFFRIRKARFLIVIKRVHSGAWFASRRPTNPTKGWCRIFIYCNVVVFGTWNV